MDLFGGQQESLSEVESGYRRDLAITNARPLFKRVILIVWSVIDIILVGLFVGYLVYYLAFGGFQDRQAIARAGLNTYTQSEVAFAHRASSLLTGSVQSFSNGDGSYDFLVEVENPNTDWWASFDYQFTSSAGETDLMEGFILPSEVRPIVALGVDFDRNPSSDNVLITNIEWHRIDHGEILDSAIWMADHNAFTLETARYEQVTLADDQIGSAQFELTNDSPYGYYSAQFLVQLERGGRIDAVNIASIAGFEPDETRAVTVNFFGAFPSTATINLIPMMNYFDEDIYLDLEGDDLFDYRDEIDTSEGLF